MPLSSDSNSCLGDASYSGLDDTLADDTFADTLPPAPRAGPFANHLVTFVGTLLTCGLLIPHLI
jgi:hypothetical protein